MAERTLNPDIKEVSIGIKELTPIKIYPLSIHDQFDITNRLVGIITDMSTGQKFTDNETALSFLQRVISDNLDVILQYVTDEEERPDYSMLTNNQCYEIVEVIFQVNYEGFIKNFQNLIGRGMKLIPQK